MKLIKNMAKATALSSVAIGGVAAYFFQFAILRKKDSNEGPDNTGTDWDKYKITIRERKEWLSEQKKENVSITSFDGLKLKAIYFPAEIESKKFVIAVHGYRSCGLNDYSAISKFYHSKGYNMLIVDNRAHGESEGKYIGFGCLDRKDCIKWIAYIVNRFGEDSTVFLHGISMGASTVLMTSGEELSDCVKGIIADCGFTSVWDVFTYILKRDYHLPSFPLMNISSKMCKILAGYDFRDCSALEQVKKAKLPILFIHGDEDNFVPTDMGRQMYDACNSEKRILIVKGAGHAESYYAATHEYESTVDEFLNKYEK